MLERVTTLDSTREPTPQRRTSGEPILRSTVTCITQRSALMEPLPLANSMCYSTDAVVNMIAGGMFSLKALKAKDGMQME